MCGRWEGGIVRKERVLGYYKVDPQWPGTLLLREVAMADDIRRVFQSGMVRT